MDCTILYFNHQFETCYSIKATPTTKKKKKEKKKKTPAPTVSAIRVRNIN